LAVVLTSCRGGELFRVLKAGGQAANCTFAGVGKTRDEIEYALKEGIYCFNAESEAEVRYIDKVAGELGKIAPIALRANPNVDAKTHAKITTGKSENKFGIDFDRVLDAYAAIAKDCPNLEIKGLQMHIGLAAHQRRSFRGGGEESRATGAGGKARHGLSFFSIGGGIGIVYKQSLDSGDTGWWAERGARCTAERADVCRRDHAAFWSAGPAHPTGARPLHGRQCGRAADACAL